MRVLISIAFLTVFCISCKTSYEVLNKGIAGNNSKELLARVNNDVVKEQPDLVVIMVGTNDMINSKKFLTFEEYSSNLKQITTKIKSALPHTKIVLTSILPVDEDYVFKRHERGVFKFFPNYKIDSLNVLIKDFSRKEDLYFIDVNSCFKGMNFKDKNSLLINGVNFNVDDGVHPTTKGYQIIGDFIALELRKQGLVKRKMKIVCFGDSITFGAFMEGKGTATGNTYPAVLLKALKN